jgi:hypothetical protein
MTDRMSADEFRAYVAECKRVGRTVLLDEWRLTRAYRDAETSGAFGNKTKSEADLPQVRSEVSARVGKSPTLERPTTRGQVLSCGRHQTWRPYPIPESCPKCGDPVTFGQDRRADTVSKAMWEEYERCG